MSNQEQFEIQDRITMKNIRLLVGCLLAVTASLIVAAVLIG